MEKYYVVGSECNFVYNIFDTLREAEEFVEAEYIELNGGTEFMGSHRGEIYSTSEYVKSFGHAPPFEVGETWNYLEDRWNPKEVESWPG
jgi:hypothetical protein